MPMVSVTLPATLTSPEPEASLECEAATVAEALRAAVAQRPRYAQRIFYKRRLLVGVVLNGRHLPPAETLDIGLADGDRLDVVPPVAGG